MNILIGILFFIFGVVLASFTNVLIYRLPSGESIVKPASHCPNCDHVLSWYENIPIFSYIFLLGKCSHCKAPISPRYLIVELFGGVSALLCFIKFGLTVDGVISALAIIILVAIVCIDYRHKIIPLSLNISLGVLAIAKLVINIILDNSYPFVHYLIGLGITLGLFMVVYLLGYLLYHKEGMGLGDVILISVAGLFLAWPGALVVTIAGSVICATYMLIKIGLKKMNREEEMAFGPFIGGAFIIMIYFANDLLTYVTGLI